MSDNQLTSLTVLVVDHCAAHREVDKLARDIAHARNKHPQAYNGDEVRHIIMETIHSGAYYRLLHAKNGWEMEEPVFIPTEEFNIIMTDEVNWRSTREHTGRSAEQQVMHLEELVDNYIKYSGRDWAKRLLDRGFIRCVSFDPDGGRHKHARPKKVRAS